METITQIFLQRCPNFIHKQAPQFSFWSRQQNHSPAEFPFCSVDQIKHSRCCQLPPQILAVSICDLAVGNRGLVNFASDSLASRFHSTSRPRLVSDGPKLSQNRSIRSRTGSHWHIAVVWLTVQRYNLRHSARSGCFVLSEIGVLVCPAVRICRFG